MQTAKIFRHGGSQAVRLPAEFRFDAGEVFVWREPATGNIVLSTRPASWADFLALRDRVSVSYTHLSFRKRQWRARCRRRCP